MDQATKDWQVWYKREHAFLATELGQLYRAHENALIAYWQKDAIFDFPIKRLQELDARSKAATKALKDKLMELAGV
jgi:hypothetical protein